MIGQPVFRLPNHPYRGFPARCPIWQLQPQRNKETAGKAAQASVGLAELAGIHQKHIVARASNQLLHCGISLGNQNRAVHPDTVGGVGLLLRDHDFLEPVKVRLVDKLAADQQIVVFQIIDAGFQVKHLFQGHFAAGEAILFQNGDKLTDSFLVGSDAAAHKEVVAHHHYIAALQCARGMNVLDFILRVKLLDYRNHSLDLPFSGGGAGIGDDGALSGQRRVVLHKAAVRVVRAGGQHGDLHAGLFQSLDISLVLLQSQLIIGLAQLGVAGDALCHCGAGRADNDILKHGNTLFLTIPR